MFYFTPPHSLTYTGSNTAHNEVTASPLLQSLSAFWVWLCLSMPFAQGVRAYQTYSHNLQPLLPREHRAAQPQTARLNRKIRRRILRASTAAPTPHAAIDLTVYRHLNRANLSPSQYLERICRLSPMGRIRIYLIGNYNRAQRRVMGMIFGRTLGLIAQATANTAKFCPAPLRPD